MLELSQCSCLFLASFALFTVGVSVLGTSLGTLAFTSSFDKVFPFGTPLWISALFVVLGGYMFVTYRPSIFLPASSHTQIWFTLIMSVIGILECSLAVSLFLWYQVDVSPDLYNCYPDLTSISLETSPSPTETAPTSMLLPLPMTCECTSGFINPPSLQAHVYRFGGVSDCSSLGGRLEAFRWALLALYVLGLVLSLSAGVLAVRRLHDSGACCGKSGAYAVTPEPNTPTTTAVVGGGGVGTSSVNGGGGSHSVPYASSIMSSPSHPPIMRSLSAAPSSGSTLPSYGVNHRVAGRSSPSAFSTYHTHYSPSTLRSQASRVPCLSTSSSHTVV